MIINCLAWLATPSNFVFVVSSLGVILLFTRNRRLAKWFLGIGWTFLVVLGLSPISIALLLPLEERFPAWDTPHEAPYGIIALGGAIDAELSVARGQIAIADAAERLTATAELARRYPAAAVLLAGGSSDTLPSEAELASRFLQSLGIAPERLLQETRSLNTAQNAQYSGALLDPKPAQRWVLVTSAAHMPRAIGAFRNAGFKVDAYPVDYQTRGRRDLLTAFSSPLRGLTLCDVAIHEWIGLAMYWIRGQTSALFPAP